MLSSNHYLVLYNMITAIGRMPRTSAFTPRSWVGNSAGRVAIYRVSPWAVCSTISVNSKSIQ